MITATATEVQNNFGKYLQMVQAGGEIIVMKNGKEVARLVSHEKSVSFLTDSLLGVLKGDYDEKEAKALEEKLTKGQMDLEDFLNQLQQIKKMGPLENVIKMLPGIGSKLPGDISIDEKQLARPEAIIRSMTPKERKKPEIINASRKVRIANGAGVKVSDVNALLKQFEQMRSMVKKFTSPGGKKKFKRMKMPF